MSKFVAAALLAASALVPSAAFAQDEGGHHHGGAPHAPQGQPPRPANRPQAPQPIRAAPQAVQQRAPGNPQAFQPRPQGGGGYGYRGAYQGGRSGYQAPVAQNGVPAPAQQGFRPGGYAGGGQHFAEQPGAAPQVRPQNFQQRGFQQQPFRGQPGYTQQGQDYRGQPGYNQQGYRSDAGGRPGYAPYQGNRQDFARDQGRYADRGAWNRGWRQDERYDWGSYRRTHYGLFNLPRYYAPQGWDYGYRRFSIGFQLDSLLFAPDYWIDDPWEYHLPPAYGDYRWVRYYNDALLVDLDTGEVVDTVYGIFY